MITLTSESITDAFPSGIGSLLPIANMRANMKTYQGVWRERGNLPYLVIDDFFEPAVLNRVLDEFPAENAAGVRWKVWNTPSEYKYVADSYRGLSAFIRFLMFELNSMPMIQFLENITGVRGLISDPCFQGAGLTNVPVEGFLDMHVDFNLNRFNGLHRRFNFIVYLNHDWRDEYGGDLVIQGKDDTKPLDRISPRFNRVVLFPTLNHVLHGHPDRIKCPPGMSRKSLSVYYFSKEPPVGEEGLAMARF